jgi:hypothetical protein
MSEQEPQRERHTVCCIAKTHSKYTVRIQTIAIGLKEAAGYTMQDVSGK